MSHDVLSGVEMGIICALQTGNSIVETDGRLAARREWDLGERGPKRVCARGSYVYSANSYDGSVTRLDVTTGETIVRQVCSYPTGIALCSEGVAVACGESNAVYLMDSDLKLRRMTGSPGFPISIASGEGRLCVARLYARRVSIYDWQELELMADMPVEGFPNCAIMRGEEVYCAYSDEGYFTDGQVVRYDERGRVSARARTGSMPSALCAGGGFVYCANGGSDSVYVYSPDLKNAGIIKTPAMPDDLLYAQGGLYVSCMVEGVVARYRDGVERARMAGLPGARGLCLI